MIDIEKIEKLAALKLKKEEKEKIQKDLKEIIHHFEVLKEIDTDGVEPYVYMKGARLFLRKDQVKKGLNKEDLKKNRILSQDKFYKVKRIMGD